MRSVSSWGDVCARLRKRIGASAYQAWFENLSAREERGALILECSDPFSLHWIRGHYGSMLEESAAPDFGEVRYELKRGPARARDIRELAAGGELASSERALREEPSIRGLEEPIGAESLQVQGGFSFENYVVGPHNVLAAEAARAVARGQSAGLCPLVLTSASGGGKSHLCRSIERAAPAGAVYCSSEEFTCEVTQALRSGQMERVRHRYRKALNVLILEDVQFLPGKRATQIELFHTLDHLTQHGKSVVLTADRAPNEIEGLDRKLASRMSGGLIARIGSPDSATCQRILADKAASGGVRIPDECLAVLAQRPAHSVRELIAGLNQVVARATLLKQSITLKLLHETLSDVDLPGTPRSIDEIMDLVARAYSLGTDDLRGPSRQRSVVRARQFAMYLCRCYTQSSLKQIGRAFQRDHTSVLHAVRVVEKRNLEQAQHRYEFEALAVRLGAPAKARP